MKDNPLKLLVYQDALKTFQRYNSNGAIWADLPVRCFTTGLILMIIKLLQRYSKSIFIPYIVMERF
jgi:hypothetical protein